MFDDMIKNITDALADADAQLATAKADYEQKIATLKDQRKKLTKALSALQTQVVQD